MISIGQRPVVANKIDLNITFTIASYQRFKRRKKYKAKRDDVISQNRRQNHSGVETRMRTALERRLGFGLLKRDRGHYWIWDFCNRGDNLEKEKRKR